MDYSFSNRELILDLTNQTDNQGDDLFGFEGVIGTSGDDILTGTSSANTIIGGAGDDTIKGSGGGDDLQGGTGTRDTLDYSDIDVALTVNLATNVSSLGDTISGFENIFGGDGNDTLTGTSGANQINGGFGNDVLRGNAGLDEVTAGEGDDIIFGGDDGDFINGGFGTDTVTYAHQSSGVTATLDRFNPAGNDDLQDVENLTGSSGDDVLTGTSGSNIILGGAGDDIIADTRGSDTLDGGDGIDTLDYSDRNMNVEVDLTNQVDHSNNQSDSCPTSKTSRPQVATIF